MFTINDFINREIIKTYFLNLQNMLNIINNNYKFKNFNFYIELIRKLYNIAINFEGDIR